MVMDTERGWPWNDIALRLLALLVSAGGVLEALLTLVVGGAWVPVGLSGL